MDKSLYLLIVFVGILIRILTGFFSYSGEKSPPKFGDYEAQRHWMELTLNVDISEWYTDDKSWWTLDYPPLTAYHEWLLGIISGFYEPASVVWTASRGYETETHRQFMRMTVLVSDLLVYFVGAFLISRLAPGRQRFASFLILILNPVAIYVDHAHFQYNSVALGFLLIGVWGVLSRRPIAAAIAYTCSFMFKQTLVFFAPVFLAYMLGEALRLGKYAAATRIVILGLTVIGTIAIIVYPIVASCETMECSGTRLVRIAHRIFPFDRGLLEDYVANTWTVLTPIFRLRDMTLFKHQLCGIGSTVGTIAGFAEVFYALVYNPTPRVFTIALAVSALSFYLFGWMVHEKAILLPFTVLLAGLPVLMDSGKSHLVFRMMEACILSMWRLMKIEGNELAAYAVHGIAWFTYRYIGGLSCCEGGCVNRVMVFLNLSAFVAVLFDIFVPPPNKLPYLWILGNCGTCCITLILVWRELIGLVKAESVPTSQKVKSI
jgi:alpha-1,3-glucosyltransferase